MESFVSHIIPDNEGKENRIQFSYQHNDGVARLASSFASNFNMGDWGYILGQLHDKGKEQTLFQQYILNVNNKLQRVQHVEHAYVGALIAQDQFHDYFPLLSYPILGHHAGLADYPKFEEYMKKAIPSEVSTNPLGINLSLPKNCTIQKCDLHHLIRMLFSCLVDADYLDTESFMSKERSSARGHHKSLQELLPLLNTYLDQLAETSPKTEVNRIRKEVQKICLSSSKSAPGFYSLTVPTGGGKTLSSILWAFHHAIKYQKKRIIIVIPYNSIIVQTAHVLKSIFGDNNVLEHHSDYLPSDKDDNSALMMRLATENWDYPIIVTTNVQFFESVFSNRPSLCRKLHNICNSVVIFDEVQTLPLSFLQPIVDSLKTYQRLFGASVLFTTASLPAIKGNHGNSQATFYGIADITEIVPSRLALEEKLRRTKLIFDTDISSYKDLASRLSKYQRVLCIVNTRKDAQELFKFIPKEGLTLHLSRMMCSKHIRETLNALKLALNSNDNSTIRVISTQLIEAGVDVDFPVVFRQESGLDSILQAAGRCNREGRQSESNVYIFSFGHLPIGSISHANDARKSLGSDKDWFSPETMTDYFIELYKRTQTFDEKNIASLLYRPFDFCFETAAQEFKLITDNTNKVIVNYEESSSLVALLKKEGPNYSLLKELDQYSVNLRECDFKDMYSSGLIEQVLDDVYYVPRSEQYDNKIGLIKDNLWLNEVLTI